MDPTHLKISKHKKTKKVIVPPSVMINQPNLRQILLDKLLKHRKTQKRNESSPSILNNDFDTQSQSNSMTNTSSFSEQSSLNNDIPMSTGIPLSGSIMNDKPYGVLKNGLKPTYKTWNKSQKNTEICPIEPMPMPVSAPVSAPAPPPAPAPIQIEQVVHVFPEVESCPIEPETKPREPRENKKEIKVGKSKKTRTVNILIPCHKTRKLRSETRESYKKTNLTTVKNYLKHHRLIKVGSTAPTNLIREIYENARSYGDIVNENKQNLLYNYEKDSE